MRRDNPEKYEGKEIHEVHPVKFGGNPVDHRNKRAVPRDVHRKQLTPFWNRLQAKLRRLR